MNKTFMSAVVPQWPTLQNKTVQLVHRGDRGSLARKLDKSVRKRARCLLAPLNTDVHDLPILLESVLDVFLRAENRQVSQEQRVVGPGLRSCWS